MRKVAILVLVAALAVPARAADDAAAKKGGKPGTNIEMPFLMAPLSDADGKLLGYAYISSRLTAGSDVFALAVRDKLPFIQDALIRDVNATAIAMPDDPEKVNIPQLESRMLGDARKVMGPGKVKLITVCTVQISELHPVRPPAPDVPPDKLAPGAPPPKNPVKSRCES